MHLGTKVCCNKAPVTWKSTKSHRLLPPSYRLWNKLAWPVERCEQEVTLFRPAVCGRQRIRHLLPCAARWQWTPKTARHRRGARLLPSPEPRARCRNSATPPAHSLPESFWLLRVRATPPQANREAVWISPLRLRLPADSPNRLSIRLRRCRAHSKKPERLWERMGGWCCAIPAPSPWLVCWWKPSAAPIWSG